MKLIINIYYTGTNGSAKKFIEEMTASGIVDKIRSSKGNEKYEYFLPVDDSETVLLIDKWENKEALDMHHKSEIMKEISKLREKYHLKMRVEIFREENL